jgi:Flp pilus assembly protein TadG
VTGPPGHRRSSGEHGERGAAPVDFVLLAGLLTVLFLMLVQVGVALHVRNVLASAAAEGARYGANADFVDHEGAAEQQTRAIIATELASRFADNVDATVVDVGGEPAIEVDVSAPMPLIGLWGSARTIHVRGHALREGG